MARGAALFGAVLCLFGCARAWPPAAPQPVQAVLAYEAGWSDPSAARPRGERPVCFSERTQGRAFERERLEYRALRERRPGYAADEASRVSELRDLDHVGEVAWERPSRPGEPAGSPRELDPAAAAELADAARRVLATEPGPVAPIALAPLPPQLLPVGNPQCGEGGLQFTAPAFAGDIAFVESILSSCQYCANGGLYALRREGDQWRVVAVARTWVT